MADLSTREGASILAAAIEKYWRDRGAVVHVATQRKPGGYREIETWTVVSNMRNGWPPKMPKLKRGARHAA